MAISEVLGEDFGRSEVWWDLGGKRNRFCNVMQVRLIEGDEGVGADRLAFCLPCNTRGRRLGYRKESPGQSCNPTFHRNIDRWILKWYDTCDLSRAK